MYDPPLLFADQVVVITLADGSVQLIFAADVGEIGPTVTLTKRVLARVKLPADIAADFATRLPGGANADKTRHN